MRNALVCVLLLSACGETRQMHRWPSHRREKDAEIEALAKKSAELEARVAQLEQQIGQLAKPAPVDAAAPGD